MVVCYFSAHIPCVKKCKFAPCIRKWKLRDPATASQFQSIFKFKRMTAAATVATTSSVDADTSNCVESAWWKLKDALLDAANEVCGLSKNHQWKPETTWWWIEGLDKALLQEKCVWFKVYSTLKIGGMSVGAGGQKLPTLMPSVRQNMPSRWQRKYYAKLNGPRLLAHLESFCSWDAESCFWGKIWAGKTINRGCFQPRHDLTSLGGELHSEPLWGWRWNPWRPRPHRSSHAPRSSLAVGMGTRLLHLRNGEHQWDAVQLCAW